MAANKRWAGSTPEEMKDKIMSFLRKKAQSRGRNMALMNAVWAQPQIATLLDDIADGFSRKSMERERVLDTVVEVVMERLNRAA
jgi:hypothetical protein